MSSSDTSGSSSVQGSSEASSSSAAASAPAKGSVPAAATAGDESFVSVSSMGQLKAQAPAFYHLLMVSLATTICNNMQHQQERLKKAWRGINS